jgi:acyl-CoA reductase-like NAD-dependent aldehyde dehydrogenase
MKIYPLYAGGQFKSTPYTQAQINPYTQKVITNVCLAQKKDIEHSILAASKAAPVLKALTMRKRAKILKSISELILKHQKPLCNLIVLETAKPLQFAKREVLRCAETFKLASMFCNSYTHSTFPKHWSAHSKNVKSAIYHEPSGLVLAITPFNFPLNLPAHKIAPAIAAGCPIILKPAPQTPLSILYLAKLIHSIDLPKGALSVLPMSNENAQHVVQSQRYSVLSFTGSPQIGWRLKAFAHKRKCILELGGNAATIISASADITQCIHDALESGFAFSGQVCIHAQRFYVHPVHYDNFVAQMKTAISKLKKGNPKLPGTSISVLISEKEAIRIESWVNSALKSGARCITGGKRYNSYYEPTILCNTNSNMSIHSEEAFGPVICINRYNGSISDAVECVNDSKYGLQNSIYTSSKSEYHYALQHLQAGALLHNKPTTYRLEHMPYGGIKESGFGREGVIDSFYAYTEPKLSIHEF